MNDFEKEIKRISSMIDPFRSIRKNTAHIGELYSSMPSHMLKKHLASLNESMQAAKIIEQSKISQKLVYDTFMDKAKVLSSAGKIEPSAFSNPSMSENTIAAIKSPSIFKKVLEPILEQQDIMKKHLASLNESMQAAKIIEQSKISQKLVYDTFMDKAKVLSSVGKIEPSAFSNPSMSENTIAAIKSPSIFKKVLEPVLKQQEVMQSAMLGESMKLFTEKLNSFSRIDIGLYASMAKSLSEIDLDKYAEEINEVQIEEELEYFQKSIESAESSKELETAFEKLPALLKCYIVYFFLYIFIPFLSSIAGTIVTPTIQSYLLDSDASKREKINYIKKIPAILGGIDVSHHRFITGDNVRLRELPSTKSEILDEMVLGQVVEVLSKKKNWIEITYSYEDGRALQGWVFTRYTMRFKK